MARVQVVAFSKDRPGQLRELLRSLGACARGAALEVDVLFVASNAAIAERYAAVAAAGAAGLARLQLHREADFGEDLLGLLLGGKSDNDGSSSAAGAAEGPSPEFVMLCVDDLVFHTPFALGAAVAELRRPGSDVFGFQPRLSPCVFHCQTRRRACSPPAWDYRAAAEGYAFAWREGTLDWSYPWDLCGAVYRRADVAALVARMQDAHGPGALRNPNTLEEYGNRVLRRDEAGEGEGEGVRPRLLCPARPVACVVSVNRVQTEYKVPTCAAEVRFRLPRAGASGRFALAGDEAQDLEVLNELLCGAWRYDLERYRFRMYSSVHVGDVFLTATTGGPEPEIAAPAGWAAEMDTPDVATPPPPSPRVSVLMPARDCAGFVGAAIASLRAQSLEGFEVVVLVDALSQDGTAEALRASVDADPAFAARCRVEPYLDEDASAGRLGRMLNAGLALCRGEVVARADADDVNAPLRLAEQLRYLDEHPGVDAVGAAVAVVAGEAAARLGAAADLAGLAFRTRVYHTHPLLVPWSAAFGCPVAHPAVAYRRRAVQAAGGYRPVPCEDYDLWARLLFPEAPSAPPSAVANLPAVHVVHRKHGASVTAQQCGAGARDAAATAAAMDALLRRARALNKSGRLKAVLALEVPPAEAEKLRSGGDVPCASLDEATRLSKIVETLEKAMAVYLDGLGAAWPAEERHRAMQAINLDATNRLGVIAAVAASEFGAGGIALLTRWIGRQRRAKN
uniref:Glycosyltransferase 2-like domain-containing protein n=1 Tax=Phaeomonas parva TaxID=124430 RepID=A0A7S1TPH7_9STRA|mmetsp:Transcript_11121/g.33836  ORF Transcript_11121/g.33836 Transcript_11121/m.33836 type:complete len:737 (+) Transcript_11121:154-2364(+)